MLLALLKVYGNYAGIVLLNASLEFSTKFLRFTPHTFVLTAMCPVFKYPNQRWVRGNANKSFKIFDEDCSSVCL